MNLIKKITDKIRYIQSQPESVKSRYVWLLTFVIFVIFVAIWLIFLKIKAPSAENKASAPMTDVKNNLSNLKDKIKNSYGGLKNEALPEFKELLKDTEKTTSANDLKK